MKKSLLLIGLISGLGFASLASCAMTNKGKTELTKSESLSMQAATSLSMIGDLNSPSKMNLMKSKKMENNTLTDAEKEDVKKILPTLDLMLSNSSSFDSVIENGNYTPVVEDGTLTFNVKEIINFLGTDGTKCSYTLYYNIEKEPTAEEATPDGGETTPEDQTTTPEGEVTTPEGDATTPDADKKADEEIKPAKDIEDEEDDDDDKEDEESNEVETEEKINGLAFLDESNYYPFESIVEKEISKDETEEERTFKIDTAKDSYIQVKQEHEVEGNEVETEFAYKVVENGKTTLEYSIEIEKEDDQLELGYEIGGIEYELVKEEIDGETIYHVEVENEETDTEALISFKKITNEETGEVSYEEIIK